MPDTQRGTVSIREKRQLPAVRTTSKLYTSPIVQSGGGALPGPASAARGGFLRFVALA